MTYKRILYVCTDCEELLSEACGYFDRNDLAVMPDGAWLCANCVDEITSLEAHGVHIPEDEFKPVFKDFPKPPEYRAAKEGE